MTIFPHAISGCDGGTELDRNEWALKCHFHGLNPRFLPRLGTKPPLPVLCFKSQPHSLCPKRETLSYCGQEERGHNGAGIMLCPRTSQGRCSSNQNESRESSNYAGTTKRAPPSGSLANSKYALWLTRSCAAKCSLLRTASRQSKLLIREAK